MSKSSLCLYFVVLVFSPPISCISTMCKDCREDSQEHCLIRNSTGYSILPYDYVLSESPSFVSVIDDFSVCIPADLTIKERKFTILCVWSPELGCQMLVDWALRSTDCLQCRVDTLQDGIPRCPCEKVLQRPKAQKKFEGLESGSGLTNYAALQILISVIVSVFF